MVPKVQATSPVSDPRVFVRSLGQARLCSRGAVRGADPLPLAAQGAAARGGRAGRLGSIKPPRPHGLPRFPAQRGRRGDPLGKRWDRGRSQDAAETPPRLLSGPGPSPPRPALRPGGGGADKGSRTALPAPEGGGVPGLIPPLSGVGYPAHPAVSMQTQMHRRPGSCPLFPECCVFSLLMEGRHSLSPHPGEVTRVKHLAQRSTLVVPVASH